MIEFSLCQYYTVFLLFTIFINASLSYNKLSTDDHKLCSPITKRKLKLDLDSLSGLVVTLGRSSYHAIDWDKNHLCKFQIETGQANNGLFAVIQNIVFRKNETTDECIDYVQFKRRDGSSSKKYCGRLNAALGMDPIFAPDLYVTSLAPTINSFIDPLGQMDVYIYIARESLRFDEEMNLEIVFTSFRQCIKKEDRQCSEQYSGQCIYKGFFNDGYVNCPHPGCVDENGCSEKIQDEHKKSIGNKVIIGSVTLLLFVFVIFICFVWLCRRYKKLCWAEEFANTNTITQQTRPLEMNEPSTIRETPMTSTVGDTVPTNHGTSSTEEDKDLPPSYESLFPDR